ncbi:hypothetical protein GCG54_00000802 [Colletotrichum gloeosporioides]|uniref:Uncharacterized protein n=1 Tax=Colletotrichum gloeosporioides TaxID=474922 RepID=A0A8H4CI79_COLGL|nr:uncharacterized protein GCG54_00000802 [Colletotrichum gloeosporioides]KAF3804448.1 hypothetical protein GCG54_00000802 [Colletotrichum gloeosporioides]
MSTTTTTTETMRVEVGSIPYYMDQPKSSKLGFLDMPCEIRLQVYRHLFVRKEPIRPRQLTPDEILDTPGEIRKRGIIFTCKKISKEAIEVLYRENTFAFGPGRYTERTTVWGPPSAPPTKAPKAAVLTGKIEDDDDRATKRLSRDAARAKREAAKADARWRGQLEPKVSVSTESDMKFFFQTSRANASLVRRVLLRGFPWSAWQDKEPLSNNVRPIVNQLQRFSHGLDSVEIDMPDDTAKNLRGAMTNSGQSRILEDAFHEDRKIPKGIHPEDEVYAFLAAVYATVGKIKGIRSLSVKMRPLSKDADRNQISMRRILKFCGWIKVSEPLKVDTTHPLLPWIEEELGVDLRVRECLPGDLYKLLHYKEYIYEKHGVSLQNSSSKDGC